MKSGIDKVVIVGAGNVGEAIGYSLLLRRQATDIVFVDLDTARAHGAALDVAHANTYVGKVNVRSGGYEECRDADIIIVTAGAKRKPGQTRLDLARTNISIMTSITKSVMEFATDPVVIVVSNPVDLMTYVFQRVSGLPATQVIGTGTALDTARFRCMIADELHVDVNDVNAFILGEHGDSQVPIWSTCTIAGEDIHDYIQDDTRFLDFDFDEIARRTKDAGAEIIAAKGATFYGIAMSVTRIVEAIKGNEGAVMSVSHVFEYGFDGLTNFAISMPCKVARRGIHRTLNYKISEEEYQKVKESASVMASLVRDCFEAQ